jgi:uncharacterized DUF497 family protein
MNDIVFVSRSNLLSSSVAVADVDFRVVTYDIKMSIELKADADLKAVAEKQAAASAAVWNSTAADLNSADVPKSAAAAIVTNAAAGVKATTASVLKTAQDTCHAADLEEAQDSYAADDLKAAEDSSLSADFKEAQDVRASSKSKESNDQRASPQGSIAVRVKDKAAAKRMAANTKAAAGFKALAEKNAVQGMKTSEMFVTPVKAKYRNKENGRSRSSSEKAAITKETPEKTAAERVAAAVLSRAVYEANCDTLEAVHLSEDDEQIRVISVRAAAHRRAVSDFESAYSRLSDEDHSFVPDEESSVPFRKASQALRFVKHLQDTVWSLADDHTKAINDRRVAMERYNQKMLKYFEVARLDWIE